MALAENERLFPERAKLPPALAVHPAKSSYYCMLYLSKARLSPQVSTKNSAKLCSRSASSPSHVIVRSLLNSTMCHSRTDSNATGFGAVLSVAVPLSSAVKFDKSAVC